MAWPSGHPGAGRPARSRRRSTRRVGVPGQHVHDVGISDVSARSRRTRAGTSSSSGTALARTATATGSSASATTARAGPRERVPRQLYTTGEPGDVPPSRPTRAGTSSSSGTAMTRTADDDGIFGQRYDSAGVASGSRVPRQLVHDEQPDVSLRRLRRERQLRRGLAERRQDGDDYGIFGQRYDSAGVPQGGEFRVNSYTTATRCRPRRLRRERELRRRLDEHCTRTAAATVIFGQRYDSAGVRSGGRVPRQLLHDGAPEASLRRLRRERELRRRLASRQPGRQLRRDLRPAVRQRGRALRAASSA